MGAVLVILLAMLLARGHWGYALFVLFFLWLNYGDNDNDIFPKR